MPIEANRFPDGWRPCSLTDQCIQIIADRSSIRWRFLSQFWIPHWTKSRARCINFCSPHFQKNIKAKSKPRHAGSSTTPRSSTNKKRQQFRHRVAKKLRSRQDQQLEQLTALRTFSTVFRDGTGPFCAPASRPPFPAILSQLPTFSFLILPLLSTSFPLLSPLMLLINSSTISTSSIVCFENLSRFTTSRDCQLLNC